ncbi:MAG TPA: TIGR02677 family protein [Bacillota bacterium]|nr:TIGR02677 family protein [Bacillota bacterium]
MRQYLFPEEILTYLMGQKIFQDYTIDQLHLDLAQLVEWNNLTTQQETGRAQTIEEFKKKRFRYQPTPYTIEFERMLIAMEKGGDVFGGSLEKKEFERLYQSLQEMEKVLEKESLPEADECAQIWNDIFTYFGSITKNTSDYIAHVNSEQAQEQMQTEAFLVFKDQFTTYLRDFIIGLQQTALKIQYLVRALEPENLKPFVKKVVVHQQNVPRFEDVGLDEADLSDEQMEKWTTLKTWFLGDAFRESELDNLQERTNEQIRRITRVVQRLGERHHYFRSRKKEYLNLAQRFSELDTLSEAHRLSAAIFGVFHTKHLFSDQIPSDDVYSSVWNEQPVTYPTKPRIRNYREKTRPGAVVNQQKRKEQVKQAYLKEKETEEKALKKYMQEDVIRLSEINQIEPHIRKMLLAWVGKAMMKKNRTFKTEHGRIVKVLISTDKRVVLHAPDGDMDMPEIVFHFLENTSTT